MTEGAIWIDGEYRSIYDVQDTINKLRAELAEFKAGVRANWWYFTDDGEAGCRHCHATVEIPEDYDMDYAPDHIDHTPECLVLKC